MHVLPNNMTYSLNTTITHIFIPSLAQDQFAKHWQATVDHVITVEVHNV